MMQKAAVVGLGRLVLLTAVVVACADPGTGAIQVNDPLSNVDEVPNPPSDNRGQYVVLFKDGVSDLADPLTASGEKLGNLRHLNGAVYANVDNPDALLDDPNVASVSENFLSYHQAPYPTTATYYARNWQWGMKQIRANAVPVAVQGQGTKACIMDSGIDMSHQDLAGKVVAHASFVDIAHGYPGPGPSPAPLDSNGHGSHVASTVTSNGIGVAGVAPQTQLMAAKVFAATGGASLAAIWDAMAWCVANGADMINMSLGGLRTRPLSAANVALKATYEANIAAARGAGVLVIVAAGNDNIRINDDLGPAPPAGDAQEVWPASLAGAVTVGATAPVSSTAFPNASNFPWIYPLPGPAFDQRAGYSNYGNEIDVWAPGGSNFINRIQSQIVAACSSFRSTACASGKFYMSISGTSMATPHAVGVASLITSRSAAPKNLARTVAVENCLSSTGDNITIAVGGATPSTNTRPRINALRAATEACPGL